MSVEAGLLLRLATAELRDGQFAAAMAHVDEVDAAGDAPVLERWQVEWNVARSLQARGDTETALQRVQRLLEPGSDPSVPAALDLRLRWLEGRLRMNLGWTDGLLNLVDALLSRIESFPEGRLEAKDAELLTTESMLLKAELVFQSKDAEGAGSILTRLREAYRVRRRSDLFLSRRIFICRWQSGAAQETLAALAVQNRRVVWLRRLWRRL